VGLARAGAEDFRAEAREIVVRLPGGDHLDSAAGEAIAHWPDRAAARAVLRPVEHVAQRGQLDGSLLLAGDIVSGGLRRHWQLNAAPGRICGSVCAHRFRRSLPAHWSVRLRSAVWPTVWGS